MNVDTIPDFLAELGQEAHSDLQPVFLDFEDLWERKLWHQLTDALVSFFNHKESAPQRLPMYNKFILTFADKINQLKLVTLALSASLQCRSKWWLYLPVDILLTFSQHLKSASPSSLQLLRRSITQIPKMPTYTPQLLPPRWSSSWTTRMVHGRIWTSRRRSWMVLTQLRL